MTIPPPERGQDVSPPNGPVDHNEVIIGNMRKAITKLEDENDELRTSLGLTPSRYREFYYQEYMPEKARLELSALRWQQRASDVMLWLVVFVGFFGVCFSGFQLARATAIYPAIRNSDQKSVDGEHQAIPEAASTISISVKEVRVTSSVIGILVLIISVGYLYLFLNQVYQIRQIGPPSLSEQHAISVPAEQKKGEN